MSSTEDGPIVLASASEARSGLLRNAGIAFVRDPADIDEAEIKATCRSQGDAPEEAAVRLAAAKAMGVAARHPGALVIGADQLLVCNNAWLDKPTTRAAARATLEALRGQQHRLVSGIAIARDHNVIWEHVQSAQLKMRSYSDSFIEWYLTNVETSALQVVGACRLEGIGVQAFERIEGDYFTILGMPLLPLLEFLRRQRLLPV
jgi:nucleoside triphosphate pyrophosphatase